MYIVYTVYTHETATFSAVVFMLCVIGMYLIEARVYGYKAPFISLD